MDAGEAARVLEGLAAALGSEIDEATLLEVGHFATTMIVARTKTGVDADRAAFKPYSKRYAAWRRRKGLETGHRDLAVKGHMLGALVPVVTGPDEVTLRFLSRVEADKARWQNDGTRTVPRSEFMDVRAPEELDALLEVFGEAVIANLEKRK